MRIIKCDGCQRTADCPSPSELPKFWGTLAIRVTGFRNTRSMEGTQYEANTDLCPNCQITFRDSLDPKKWPKPE